MDVGSWEPAVLIVALAAAPLAGVIFASFELLETKRVLRARTRHALEHSAEVLALLALLGLLGAAVASGVLAARGLNGWSRPALAAAALLAALLLLPVIRSLGRDRHDRRKRGGPSRAVAVSGVLLCCVATAAAAAQLKRSS